MNRKTFFLLLFILALLAFKSITFAYIGIGIALLTQVGFGTILAFIIDVFTIGMGKSIANYIAMKKGYDNCGCDARIEYLNKMSKIELIEKIQL